MSFKKNLKLLAFIQIFIAILMLVPMFVSYRYGEARAAHSFLITIGIMVLFSGGVLLVLRKTEITNSSCSSFFDEIVSHTWGFAVFNIDYSAITEAAFLKKTPHHLVVLMGIDAEVGTFFKCPLYAELPETLYGSGTGNPVNHSVRPTL